MGKASAPSRVGEAAETDADNDTGAGLAANEPAVTAPIAAIAVAGRGGVPLVVLMLMLMLVVVLVCVPVDGLVCVPAWMLVCELACGGAAIGVSPPAENGDSGSDPDPGCVSVCIV